MSCLANPAAAEYLSDQRERIERVEQSFGTLGYDSAVRVAGRAPVPIRIGHREYAKGLGTHAHSEIQVYLGGEYLRFEAEVGLHWEENTAGSVVFQVYVDGEKRFDSGILRRDDPPRPVHVSVAGARQLALVVTDAGDGIACDGAHWAEARLVRDPSKPRPAEAAQTPLDIAPFARVVTCDPERRDGCRAGRLEEFPAEDVFLEQELAPTRGGGYVVPVWQGDQGCIGLVWAERRVLTELALHFPARGPVPSAEGVRVEYWSSQGRMDDWGAIGQTWWQGKWEPLPGTLEVGEREWVYRIDPTVPEFETRAGVHKIRWVLPGSTMPPRVQRLSARTRGRWQEGRFRIELERPLPGRRGEIELYNGYLLDAAGKPAGTRRRWNLGEPLHLALRYTTVPRLPDRTVIRLRTPEAAFGVAVEDVLAHGCVYVPHGGVFVVPAASSLSLADYKRQIAGRQTVLARVRQMPDQSFARAQEVLLNPRSARDPILLSLACDNRKIVVQREGALEMDDLEVTPSVGHGTTEDFARHLEERWFPIPVIRRQEGDLVYQQRTFVAPLGEAPLPAGAPWLYEKALGVVELLVENRGAEAATAAMSLAFTRKRPQPGSQEVMKEPLTTLQAGPEGITAVAEGRLLARVRLEADGALAATVTEGTVTLSGQLPAGASARCVLYLPRWEAKPGEEASLPDADRLRAATKEYWRGLLAPAMQVSVPEPLLEDVYRASQVHILIAARNEQEGALTVPWIASMTYGALDTEAQAVILAMDLLGHHQFTRRGLEYFFTRYNERGCLANGYTLMGTGQNLWTLGEHGALTEDREWLRKVASRIEQACRWILAQREKTRGPSGVPEAGMVPPGVLADWERYAYYFYAQGYYCAGLRAGAELLARIDHPAAAALRRAARDYRQDILRAYRWNQARMPVLPLADGTWVPAYPSSLYCFGQTRDFYGGVSSIGHDVEVGANHLLELGILDPTSRDGDWITNYMEDVWFYLHPGLASYPREAMQEDWFTYGGFSKLQPYYTRYADVLALRDEVKPFLRHYFNTFFPMLSSETLALWEHFNQIGAWNKTHETAWLLEQTRLMLVMERGRELWLAPFVTNAWLKDGSRVAVTNAPTRFGTVSFQIVSHVAQGYVEATIAPPTRTAPRALVLRLRHPEGKPIRSVVVNGRPHRQFDARRECITLRPGPGPMVVRTHY